LPQSIAGPWQTKTRIAVLQPWFPVNDRARAFSEISLRTLKRFRPGVIAGSVEALQRLAHMSLRNTFRRPLPDYGVLAFTSDWLPPLTEADRELFWRAFEAPVFEQYRDEQGVLLAAECEAHQGLHILSESAAQVFDAENLIQEPCPCGLRTPRLIQTPSHLGTVLTGT
jgi:hypothetical protein